MKKNSLLISMLLSSTFLFGNEYLAYEESHFSSEPIDTVQNIIDVRTDFNSVKGLSARVKNIANENYKALKNITHYDASKVKQISLQCTYKNESTGNIITSVFQNKNNMWHLKKIKNKQNKVLNRVKQKDYDLYRSQYCVDDFRANFELAYPNTTLTLIGRETLVNGIVVTKKNKTYSSTFNLSYYSLNQHTQSGWYVSKISLKPMKNRVVTNKKVPSKHRGFHLKATIPYMPNVELVSVPYEKGLKLVEKQKPIIPKVKKGRTKLTRLVCDQKDKYIRIVFTLDKNEQIRILEDKNNHKHMKFNFDGENVIAKGNCSFLFIKKNIINLEKFKHDIKSFKYGKTNDPKSSYIDFYYEKKSTWGGW